MDETEINYEDAGLWLGSMSSAVEFRKLKAMYNEKLVAGFAEIQQVDNSIEESQEEDPLLTYMGSTALLEIDGILASGEYCLWYNYGIVGYDDIRRASLKALKSGVTNLVVKITTPGGMVDGLGACSTFLRELSGSMKISFYCDTSCSSAGIWLATSVGPFVVGEYAEVGNVGVMRLLADTTKMYKDMGVTFDILKSTDLKGAGDSKIKLTPAQRDALQANVDKWGSLFVQHLATQLKLPEDTVRTTIATAEDWVGSEAVALGLASKVISFDKFVASIQKTAQNTRNSQQPTSNLRYAMSIPVIPETQDDSDLFVSALSAEPAAQVEEPVAPIEAVAPTEAVTTESPIAVFATQIAAMATENAELKLKLAAAEADKSALALQIDAAKPILRETAQGFSVRLGKAAVGLDSSDVPSLVAMITELRTEFKKAMPIGQQSASAVTTADDDDVDTLTAELTSRSIAASMPAPRKKK